MWPGENISTSEHSGARKQPRSGATTENNPANIGTKTLSVGSIVHYGCREWTQHELCWITVESNEDDTMKGSRRERCDLRKLQFELRESIEQNGYLWTHE